MRNYENQTKASVSWRPWANRCKELLDEHEIELPPNDELVKMYQDGFTYEDVLNKQLFKTRRSQYMILRVRHEKGETEIPLHNSHIAKEWFRKFPEVRKDF